MDSTAVINKDIKYFNISIGKLILLMVVTLGLYGVYWTYKNWKAIKLAEPAGISPFWRTVFAVGFDFSLYSRIQRTAESHGIKMAVPGKAIAAAQILLVVAMNVVSLINSAWWATLASSIVGSFLLIYLIVYLQQIINKSNQKSQAEEIGIKPSWVSLLFIIVGIMQMISLVFIVMFIALMAAISPDMMDAINSNDPAALEQLLLEEQQQQQQQSDPQYQRIMQLEEEFMDCDQDLQTREATLDYTSQEAIDAYNADFDQCQVKYAEYSQTVDDYNSQFE